MSVGGRMMAQRLFSRRAVSLILFPVIISVLLCGEKSENKFVS
jgi:hypothetical protein